MLAEFLAQKHHYGWSVRRDGEPRFIAFGVDWTQGGIFVGDIVWHPKASNREKLESIAALLDFLRQDFVVLFASKHNDKKGYERLVDYGIARRVGSVHGFNDERESLALFQTRTLKKW